MAWSYVTGPQSSGWSGGGSSVTRYVYARLYYQVTETPTTYKIEVYGQCSIYKDNVTNTINGVLNLTNTAQTTGSKAYTYSSSGSNHTGVYYTICSTKSYTWTKTHTTQSASASMRAYKSNDSSKTSTASASFTIPALASYTVSYNANGGTGTIADDTKWYGEDLVLSDGTGFSRDNYELVGWNTAADGSGTHYDLGETYTTDELDALTLYAEWLKVAVSGKMKINGSWEEGEIYLKANGTWVQPHTAYMKVNGVWEEVTT